MNNDDEWEKKKDEDDFDPFDISKIFKKFGGNSNDFFQNLQKMLEEFIKNSPLSKNLGDADHPFVWGFSVKPGPNGNPVINPFGDSAGVRTPSTPRSGAREPLIDILTEDDYILVIAEIPGVEKDDIDIDATENKLIIKAQNKGRRYFKRLSFTRPVIPTTGKAKFKNGILEVKFDRKTPSSINEKISID